MPLFIHCIPCKCACLLWALFSFLSLPSLFFISSHPTPILIEWTLLHIASTPFSFPIILDTTGLIFSSVVLFISANVMQFTAFYMDHDPFKERFSHLVLLFVASMNLLIFIPHLIFLLIGWDGLGVTSFILVIYYQNSKSLAGGMLTALTNRIGDTLILLGIALYFNLGNWTYICPQTQPFNPLLLVCLTIAALTKSAQMPFSSWLPAAMAAPTPVSALVHSSTLVTAGIFLLIRFYPSLSHTPLKPLILLTASMTMLMASLAALGEMDLKKIIALSTLSQLGIMAASLGLNLPNLALFHLLSHALFKALLFLCAGTIIFYSGHAQDLRSFGNYSSQFPNLMAFMIISLLALIGTPFLPAFYSKDLILETSLTSTPNLMIIILFLLSAALTTAYSLRLLLTIIWTPSLSPPFTTPPPSLHLSVVRCGPILSVGAIIGGTLLSWAHFPTLSEPLLPPPLKFLIPTATILITSFFLLYKPKTPTPLNHPPLTSHLMCSMWFLTPISSQLAMNIPLNQGHTLLKLIDHGWCEISGGQGAHLLTLKSSSLGQLWQANLITSHLSLILFTAIPLTLLSLHS